MTKYIFLDFDGVITTEKSRFNLDKEKCDRIQYIIDKTNAKVVISSTWRMNTLEETINYLNTITDRVPFVVSWIDNIVGVTIRSYHYLRKPEDKKLPSIPRGWEIKQWIEENIKDKDYRYVILDDDMDMLLEQKSNFIHTCSFEGLSKSNMYQAINILNK